MAFRQDASTEGLTRTAGLPSSTAFTIAGWFRKRGTGDGDWEQIAGLLSSGGANWGIIYAQIAGGGIAYIHGSSGDTSLGVTLATDTWYYFAVGCNGTASGNLTGWIITQGGTVYTASTWGVSFSAAEMSLLKSTGYGEWVNGAVANVMVWNTKLTTAELQQQMWSSVPIVKQANVHLWTPLWGASDLYDLSGNGRSWTSMGGTPSTEDHPPVSWNAPVTWVIGQAAPASGYTLTASAGSYGLTGTAMTPNVGRKVTAAAGTYALTGTTTGLLRGFAIAADAGSYSYTGINATLTYNPLTGYDLLAAAGSYTLTGSQASILIGRRLTALTGSFTITGTDAGLLVSRLLSALVGSYALTGISAGVERGFRLSAVAGAYGLTGAAASLLVTRLIAANAGTYAVNGTAATLTWSEEGLVHYTLTANPGSYALSGATASLLRGLRLQAGSDSYSIAGTDASLIRDLLLLAGAGSYALSGISAYLERGFRLSALAGSYNTSGTAARLLHGWLLTALFATYLINGQNASLQLNVGGIVEKSKRSRYRTERKASYVTDRRWSNKSARKDIDIL